MPPKAGKKHLPLGDLLERFEGLLRRDAAKDSPSGVTKANTIKVAWLRKKAKEETQKGYWAKAILERRGIIAGIRKKHGFGID